MRRSKHVGANFFKRKKVSRVSSGVAALDHVLDGGFVRGSSVIVFGSITGTRRLLAQVFVERPLEHKIAIVSADEILPLSIARVMLADKPSNITLVVASPPTRSNTLAHEFDVTIVVRRGKLSCLKNRYGRCDLTTTFDVSAL